MIYQLGETVRLSDWTYREYVSGETEEDAEYWTVALNDINDPGGWGVTFVSGSFGEADAVIDVTIPASLIAAADYDQHLTFTHWAIDGEGVTHECSAVFVVVNTSVGVPGRLAYAVTKAPSGVLFSAVVEYDGVHIYRVASDLTQFEDRGTLERHTVPGLVVDESGVIYLLAVERAESLADYALKFYRSHDSGLTFEEYGTAPFSGSMRFVTLSYLGHGRMVAGAMMADGTTADAVMSRDFGQSWSEFAAEFVNLSAVYLLATGEVFYGRSNLARFSRDMLKTIAYSYTGFYLKNPDGTLMGAGVYGGDQHLITPDGSVLVISLTGTPGKIYCSRVESTTPVSESVLTAVMSPAAEIVSFDIYKHGNQVTPLFLIHNAATNLLYATNGRLRDGEGSWHYSNDMGRTWNDAAPVEDAD